MSETKETPTKRGELEFHFANEVGAPDAERARRALARHERRHPHP